MAKGVFHVIGGVHGKEEGHAWQRWDMLGKLGVCGGAGGVHAGETVIAADSMHPNKMNSCC